MPSLAGPAHRHALVIAADRPVTGRSFLVVQSYVSCFLSTVCLPVADIPSIGETHLIVFVA
jgi:hypothetical protein